MFVAKHKQDHNLISLKLTRALAAELLSWKKLQRTKTRFARVEDSSSPLCWKSPRRPKSVGAGLVQRRTLFHPCSPFS